MKRFFHGMQWAISPLLLFFMPSGALSQTVRYTYDDSGNRVGKTITKAMSRGGVSLYSEPQTKKSWLGDSVIIVTSRDAITVLLPDYKKTDSYHCTINTVGGIMVGDADMESAKRMFKIKGKAREAFLVSVTINDETQTWKVTLK